MCRRIPFAQFLDTFNPQHCTATAFEFPIFSGYNYWPHYYLTFLHSTRCLKFHISYDKRGRRNSSYSYDIAADIIYPRDRHAGQRFTKGNCTVYTENTEILTQDDIVTFGMVTQPILQKTSEVCKHTFLGHRKA